MNFDLHRLRLLVELSYRGTITAVAAALSYSPTTVSQQLALLQKEAGVPLLEASGRRVRLTPEAHTLIAHAQNVFQRLEAAEADLLAARSDVIGTVRAAVFQTVVLALFPRMLELVAERHPRLRVEISQAESELARSGLLPRDFDIVIDEVYPGYPLVRSDKLSQELLLTDPMRLAFAPGKGRARRLADYATASWVMEPKGSPAREWAVAECRAAGFEPDVQFELPDVIVHERLVQTGRAVAFLPDLLAPCQGGGVDRRLLDPRHERRVVATTRVSAQRHPAVRTILGALAEVSGADCHQLTGPELSN